MGAQVAARARRECTRRWLQNGQAIRAGSERWEVCTGEVEWAFSVEICMSDDGERCFFRSSSRFPARKRVTEGAERGFA